MERLSLQSRLAVCGSALSLLNATAGILLGDLQSNIDELLEILKAASKGEPRSDDLNYHLKTSIRSLFGLAEAVHNSMALAILQNAGNVGLIISNSDRAVLMERDYDEKSDTCLAETRRYPLGRRLQTSFRLFLIACGASPLPSWSRAMAGHFRDLTQARNRLTHPTRIEDLLPLPAFDSFRHVAILFSAEVSRVLARAAAGLGLLSPEVPACVTVPPLPQSIPRLETIFDDDFYYQVFTRPAVAIRYIDFFNSRLHEDTRRAFSVCSSALAPPYQFIDRAVREMVREITTSAEGTIGFTSFFMRAVRRTGYRVAIPQRVRNETVPDRLVRTLTAFSDAFGEGHHIEKDARWPAFCEMFDIRHRLTHPRQVSDLELNLDHLGTVLSALGWYVENAQPALYLNGQKVERLYGSRRKQMNPALKKAVDSRGPLGEE